MIRRATLWRSEKLTTKKSPSLSRPAAQSDIQRDRRNCSEGIHQHVLLRVPDVTLTAEEIRSGFGVATVGGVEPLDQLVRHRDEADRKDGEQTCHRQAYPLLVGQVFDDAERVEADAEVANPVVHVALESESPAEPAERHALEGVVSADCVP